MAYVEPPDRLRRVGAAVAVLLLVVAATLAGIIAWELLRADGGVGRLPTVAAIPEATIRLSPPEAAEPADLVEPEAPVEPVASEVASVPITEPPTAALPETAAAVEDAQNLPVEEPPQVATLGFGALRPAPDPAVLEQSALGPLFCF